MTAMVDERAGRADLSQLAERMEVSQNDEIAQLEAWLEARGEDVPDEHADHSAASELMPGTLTVTNSPNWKAPAGRPSTSCSCST